MMEMTTRSSMRVKAGESWEAGVESWEWRTRRWARCGWGGGGRGGGGGGWGGDAARADKRGTGEAGRGGGGLAVIKAQVHGGGGGKAGFVKLVKSPEEATAAARFMLTNRMVSPQTPPEGL